MNKKQRNRKIVTQNKRNRMINRRYSSTIKTLFKLFLIQIQEINKLRSENNLTIQSEKVIQLKNLQNKLFSLIDKGVKKRVFHKNTANRKKSKIGLLLKPSI